MYSTLMIHSRLLIQDPPTGFLECDVSVHDNKYLTRLPSQIDMFGLFLKESIIIFKMNADLCQKVIFANYLSVESPTLVPREFEDDEKEDFGLVEESLAGLLPPVQEP